MLTVSDFFAKYDHFVVTFDADKAVLTVDSAAVAAAVVREPVFAVGLVLVVVAVVATVVAALGGTP